MAKREIHCLDFHICRVMAKLGEMSPESIAWRHYHLSGLDITIVDQETVHWRVKVAFAGWPKDHYIHFRLGTDKLPFMGTLIAPYFNARFDICPYGASVEITNCRSPEAKSLSMAEAIRDWGKDIPSVF